MSFSGIIRAFSKLKYLIVFFPYALFAVASTLLRESAVSEPEQAQFRSLWLLWSIANFAFTVLYVDWSERKRDPGVRYNVGIAFLATGCSILLIVLQTYATLSAPLNHFSVALILPAFGVPIYMYRWVTKKHPSNA